MLLFQARGVRLRVVNGSPCGCRLRHGVCVCESNSACSGGNNDNDGGCGVAVVEGKMRTESLHSLFSNQPLVPAFETFEGPDRYCYISVWLPVVKAFAPRTLSGPSPA